MGPGDLSRIGVGRVSAEPAFSPISRGASDDVWGLDPAMFRLATRLARWRWSIMVAGGSSIPADGPAMLVVFRRVGVSEAAVAATAVHRETGRMARTIGMPDLPLVAPLARRLGGGVAHADEVRALLDAGELVSIGLGWQPIHGGVVGALRRDLVGPAARRGIPVIPVVATGCELGYRWRVQFGEPVRRTHPDELVVAARAGVQALLDIA